MNMADNTPDFEAFPVKIAEPHQHGLSPNGKFGFSVQTYHGYLSQLTIWSDTWEECFAINLRGMLTHKK